MLRLSTIVLLLIATFPAVAQQQTVQDQLLITYATINNNLSKQVDALTAQAAELSKQLEAEKAKKDKSDAK